jgi:hypothetical protein
MSHGVMDVQYYILMDDLGFGMLWGFGMQYLDGFGKDFGMLWGPWGAYFLKLKGFHTYFALSNNSLS